MEIFVMYLEKYYKKLNVKVNHALIKIQIIYETNTY